jgi:hypothetical protein
MPQRSRYGEIIFCSSEHFNIAYVAHIMACTFYLLSIEVSMLRYRQRVKAVMDHFYLPCYPPRDHRPCRYAATPQNGKSCGEK